MLFPGLLNFVPAVAYLFCLNLPAAFSQLCTKVPTIISGSVVLLCKDGVIIHKSRSNKSFVKLPKSNSPSPYVSSRRVANKAVWKRNIHCLGLRTNKA